MRQDARFDRSKRPDVLTPARIFVLGVVAVLSACGVESEQPVEDLVREGSLYLHPETMEPFSGLALATFDGQPKAVAQRLGAVGGVYDSLSEVLNGRQLSSKEAYLDGIKHGPYEWYFETGQLFEQGTYKNGRLDGPYRAYWETGELYEEGTYRDGRFDGPRRWYIDGRLIELVTYRDGEMQGLYERYAENGDLDLKGMLFDGQACGTWIEGERTLDYPACRTRRTE